MKVKNDAEVKKPSKFNLLVIRIAQYFRVPANTILVLGCLVLLYFTIYPAITLISSTFTVSSIAELRYGLKLGSFTTFW